MHTLMAASPVHLKVKVILTAIHMMMMIPMDILMNTHTHIHMDTHTIILIQEEMKICMVFICIYWRIYLEVLEL